jgi:hypothetical protein
VSLLERSIVALAILAIIGVMVLGGWAPQHHGPRPPATAAMQYED